MAKKLNIHLILIISSLLVATQIHSNHAAESDEEFYQNNCRGSEKLVTFTYYVQDVLGGPNRTVYEVARSSITTDSPTAFGQIRVFDDLITVGPDYDSEKVGRVQGFIVNSDFEVASLSMYVNIYIQSGKYKGSTLTMLGRFQGNKKQRELSIVGGTGFFRFARGYAFSTTYSGDVKSDFAILKYQIYATYIERPKKCLQAHI